MCQHTCVARQNVHWYCHSSAPSSSKIKEIAWWLYQVVHGHFAVRKMNVRVNSHQQKGSRYKSPSQNGRHSSKVRRKDERRVFNLCISKDLKFKYVSVDSFKVKRHCERKESKRSKIEGPTVPKDTDKKVKSPAVCYEGSKRLNQIGTGNQANQDGEN